MAFACYLALFTIKKLRVKVSPLDAKSPHILMLAKVQLDQPTAVHSS